MSTMLADIDVFGPPLRWQDLEPAIDQLTEAVTHFETLSEHESERSEVHQRRCSYALQAGCSVDATCRADSRSANTANWNSKQACRFAKLPVNTQRYCDATTRPDIVPGTPCFFISKASLRCKPGCLNKPSRHCNNRSSRWKWLTKHQPEAEIGWHALPEAYELLSQTQQQLGKHDQARESQLESDMSRLYRDLGP